VSLESIVDVSITSATAAPTREGFGTPLVAAALVPFGATSGERSRTYSGTQAMLAEGYTTAHPAYRAAAVIFSQVPRVPALKVGRRALPPTQVIDLTPASPSTGLLYTLEIAGAEASYTALGGDDLAAVCTALAAAINAVAGEDVDAITSGASTAGTQTLTSFTGVIGGTLMDPPRVLTFTFSSSTDWDATTITVTGKDWYGATQTETFAIPNNGNATVVGTKLFSKVTQVSIPAQTGTGGTFTMGVRKRFTAVGSSGTKVAVTAAFAGMIIPYAAIGTATLSVKDATSDPGVAADLGAINGADNDWYGLVLDSNSEAEVDAAAAWAEANGKLFAPQSADTLIADSGTTTDVASDLKAAGYGRTTGWYHPDIATLTSWMGAGILGNRLPDDPGSDTWAFKTVRGVSSYALTETQKTNIHAKNWGTYTVIAGIAVTEEGKVSLGEFVDIVRGLDWLRARLRERVFGLLVRNKKVPYTDAGIALVAGEVLAGLRVAANAPYNLLVESSIAVRAPRASEVSANDKAARLLPGVEFEATLQGAIHAVRITGAVSVGGT
jgi:hypothetical protein